MKLSQEMAEKMFERWFITTESYMDGFKFTTNERKIMKDTFRAAFALLVPIIERLQETNGFYADKDNWDEDCMNDTSDHDSWKMAGMDDWELLGGKRARETEKWVEQELKKWEG